MAYEFTQYEQEPEAQAAGARYGGPPRKHTGIGLLDPPVPPKKPPSPTPAIPRTVIRMLAALILLGLVAATLVMLLK